MYRYDIFLQLYGISVTYIVRKFELVEIVPIAMQQHVTQHYTLSVINGVC